MLKSTTSETSVEQSLSFPAGFWYYIGVLVLYLLACDTLFEKQL